MGDNERIPPILISPRPKRVTRSKSPLPATITPCPVSATRSRTRSRSPSPHPKNTNPSSAPLIPLSICRDILSIDKRKVDTSVYSATQIDYVKIHEKEVYIKLEFTRFSDFFIVNTIGICAASNINHSIPLKCRKSTRLLREYFRLSREAYRVLQVEDEEHLLRFNHTHKDHQCLYLVRSVIKMGTRVVWGDEEEEGYNSLIWTCIYQKAQLLKDNIYEECGVLVSGST